VRPFASTAVCPGCGKRRRRRQLLEDAAAARISAAGTGSGSGDRPAAWQPGEAAPPTPANTAAAAAAGEGALGSASFGPFSTASRQLLADATSGQTYTPKDAICSSAADGSPHLYDWSMVLPPVKDQKSCGAGWAHAVVGLAGEATRLYGSMFRRQPRPLSAGRARARDDDSPPTHGPQTHPPIHTSTHEFQRPATTSRPARWSP
jgi:hypothetical protein